jgi:hypothetical protein
VCYSSYLSTRQYGEVLPQMAQTVGVSRGTIGREAIEASEEQLKQLQERRWDQVEILNLKCLSSPQLRASATPAGAAFASNL